MKRILKRNQVIVTTLAVMIAAAGYLNYSGRILEKQAKPASSGDSTILLTDGEATQVDAYSDNTYEDIISLDEDGSQKTSGEEKAEIGEAVLASTQAGGESILAAAKLNREQVRAKSREELLEVMNSASVEQEQKNSAASAVEKMAEIAEREAAAELLLEAKGYEGCVVSIADEKADVVINASSLDDASRAQIEDIVKRKTGISGENIVIIPSEQAAN